MAHSDTLSPHGSWPLKVSGTVWRSDMPDDPPDRIEENEGPCSNPHGRTPDEIYALLVAWYGPTACADFLADGVMFRYRNGKRTEGVW